MNSVTLRTILGCLGLLLGLLVGPTRQVEGADATFRAGAAKILITPEVPMWMSGYGSRNHPAEGKATELWAKALLLEGKDQKRLCLITLDLVGIDSGLTQAICARLEKNHALARHQIAINCSHTHSGPVVGKNLAAMTYLRLDETQQQLVDRYSQWLEDRVVEVVKSASEKMVPAELQFGSGKTSFAVNRRTNVEAEVPAQRQVGRLKGPVDHSVPVLAVRSPEGKLLAVTYGYACHATVVSFYDWSGDYPGYAQIELDKVFPEAINLFWAGCGADQNPLPRRSVELSQGYGKQLAETVQDVLAGPMQTLDGSLSSSYAEVDIAFSHIPDQAELEKDAASSDSFVAARAKLMLLGIQEGKPVRKSYPYPVGVWKLNATTPGQGLTWVFLGGEVVVDFALRLPHDLHPEPVQGTASGPATWIAGYSNDVMAYIPSRRVLTEGGYEGATAMIYYGLPSSWAPEVEDKIVAEVVRQGK